MAPKGTAAGVAGPSAPGGTDSPAGCALVGTGTPPPSGCDGIAVCPGSAAKNSPASRASTAGSGRPGGSVPLAISGVAMAAPYL